MIQTHVSRLKDVYDTRPADYLLTTIFKEIKNGNTTIAEHPKYRTLAEVTQFARSLLSDPNPEKQPAYESIKKGMPQFSPAAVLLSRSIPKELSGIVCLDYDDPDIDTGYAIATAAQNPHCIAAFKSLSAKPKLLIHVNPVSNDNTPLSPDNFKYAWATAAQIFEDIGTPDPAAQSVTQLQSLVYDPNIYTCWDTIPLNWDIDEDAYSEAWGHTAEGNTAEWIPIGDLDERYHIAIKEINDANGWKADGRSKTKVPCPFGGEHEHDGWESKNNGTSITKHGDSDYTFHCFKCPQSKRFSPTREKLSINPEAQKHYKAQLQTIERTEQTLNQDTLHFIDTSTQNTIPQYTIMKYETGAGKSSTLLTHAANQDKKVLALFFYHTLAEKQTEDAEKYGFHAFRYKGRGYNFDNTPLAALPVKMRKENESLFRTHNVMCPVYDDVERYQAKRLNPFPYCLRCPLLETCKQEGYWSQFKNLRDADYVSACIQTLIFNPDYWSLLNIFLTGTAPFSTNNTDTETFEETILSTTLGLDTHPADTIWKPFDFAVIDDYTTAGLYTDTSYTLHELDKFTKAWHGTKTAEVIDAVIDAIILLYRNDNTQPTINAFNALFDSLDTQTRAEIDNDLTQHAMRINGYLETMSPWTAIKNYQIPLNELTPIWHNSNWTILNQIEAVLKYTKNETQAPMFLAKDGTFTLSIPPQVNPKIKHALLMSDTADIEGTKNAFTGQKVEFRVGEGKPAQLAKGVKLFQYKDARLTTQSIFEYNKNEDGTLIFDDNSKPTITGITPKATAILEKIIAWTEAEQTETEHSKSVFISYKEFADATSPIANLEIVKKIHNTFDIVTHYDIVSGQNFDEDKDKHKNEKRIVVAFGYPKADHEVIKNESRKQNAHDPKPLIFDYEKNIIETEIYTSHHATYKDPRVDKVRKQLTVDKSKQALGRGRQIRWDNSIVMNVCAEPVPGFTESATLFGYNDLSRAQTYDDLYTIAQKKNTLTAESTIADFQQAYGCSERQARKLWEQAGGKQHAADKKAELRKQAHELTKHMSQRQAAKTLGFTLGKFQNLLKND